VTLPFKSQPVEPGQLNLRVVIQQQETTQDAFGQPIKTWVPLATVWAAIAVQESGLQYQTATFTSKVTHRITMRWTSTLIIKPSMRFVYTEPSTGVVHTYSVEGLENPDQRNRTLSIRCYELDGNE
jgi:SPP1 family predicted phage head-tail adaptor